MSTQTMEVCAELKDGSMIRINGDTVTVWLDYGLPDYTGSMEGFAELYPKQLELALKEKILKKVLK